MTHATPSSPPELIGHRQISEVVLPVTFTPTDDRVRGLAISLCHQWEVPLRLVFVSDSIEPTTPELEDLADNIRTRHDDLEVKTTHVYGNDVAVGICSAVLPGSLLLMATDHADEWSMKGSVAEAVVMSSGVPVLLFGPHAQSLRPGGDIVIGLDGSTSAEAALPAAIGLAKVFGAQLWVVQVAPISDDDNINVEIATYIQDQASVIDIPHQLTGWELIHSNDPVSALASFAEARKASVLVAGARGRTDPHRQSMGSITMGLVSTATVPVLALAV